jgi:hypothetical protein
MGLAWLVTGKSGIAVAAAATQLAGQRIGRAADGKHREDHSHSMLLCIPTFVGAWLRSVPIVR